MKRIGISVAAIGIMGAGLLGFGHAAHAAHSTVNHRAMGGMASIQLTNPMHPMNVMMNGKVPVDVSIKGFSLDAADIGKANKTGKGHYHYYIDCIPADAYRTADLSKCWAGAAATAMSSFDLKTSKVKVTAGSHLLIVALSNNNHVLVKAPASAILINVK